jgi:ATP-dependent RNA helicase DeaD
MPEAIKRIGVQFMKDPEHVKIAAKELTNDLVDQYYIRVKEQEKFDTMTRLMDVEQPELSIVFGRTKRRVDELTRGLKFVVSVQKVSTETLTKTNVFVLFVTLKMGT